MCSKAGVARKQERPLPLANARTGGSGAAGVANPPPAPPSSPPPPRGHHHLQPGRLAAFFHRRKRNKCFPKEAKKRTPSPHAGSAAAREKDPAGGEWQEIRGAGQQHPAATAPPKVLKPQCLPRHSPPPPAQLQMQLQRRRRPGPEVLQNPEERPAAAGRRNQQLIPLLNDDETFPPLPRPTKARCRQPHPLEIPELLMSALEFVGDNADVYRCLFVSRLWYHCATKILWQQAHFSSLEKATLFLSLFDAAVGEGDRDKSPSDLRVEPLAVSSTAGSGGRPVGAAETGAAASTESAAGAAAAEPGPGPVPAESAAEAPAAKAEISGVPLGSLSKKSWLRKRGKKELAAAAAAADASRPHELYAASMRKLVFYKLKTLGSPLLANAARWLPRLTFLEFYICDIITTPVITAFANSCPNLLVVKVPGCANVTDEAIIAVATHCRRLRHLDARACSLIGDRAVLQIARNCPDLAHINVGRIGGGDRITYQSISEVARRTKVDTLGLAGCDISDSTVLAIAMHRRSGLERVSFNNCPRITDRAVEALVQYCPRMAVLELKECFCVTDFRLVWRLMQKRVLVELCAAGRQRLEQFQRAELAKIAAAQERPGGAGGGGGGGGAADGESQRRRTGAAAAAAAAAASAAKEPAPTSSA